MSGTGSESAHRRIEELEKHIFEQQKAYQCLSESYQAAVNERKKWYEKAMQLAKKCSKLSKLNIELHNLQKENTVALRQLGSSKKRRIGKVVQLSTDSHEMKVRGDVAKQPARHPSHFVSKENGMHPQQVTDSHVVPSNDKPKNILLAVGDDAVREQIGANIGRNTGLLRKSKSVGNEVHKSPSSDGFRRFIGEGYIEVFPTKIILASAEKDEGQSAKGAPDVRFRSDKSVEKLSEKVNLGCGADLGISEDDEAGEAEEVLEEENQEDQQREQMRKKKKKQKKKKKKKKKKTAKKGEMESRKEQQVIIDEKGGENRSRKVQGRHGYQFV